MQNGKKARSIEQAFVEMDPAASYFPTRESVQYHRLQ